MSPGPKLKEFLNRITNKFNQVIDAQGTVDIKRWVVQEIHTIELDVETYEEAMTFIRTLHTQLNIRWKYLQDTQQID